MQFRESQAIYLQIADYVCEKILLKEWVADSRIPSVRELAIQLEVNPNTVMRSVEFLQQQDIIYNQRASVILFPLMPLKMLCITGRMNSRRKKCRLCSEICTS